MTAAKTKASAKRRKVVSLDKKKARAGWMFILPFVLGFILIYLPIVVDSLTFSVSDIKMGGGSKGGGYTLTWAGLEHYKDALFKDTSFVQTLTTGLKELVFDIPAIVVFSLFIAVLLNKKMFGRAAFRAIFFIPVILSTGLIDSVSNMGAVGNSYFQGGVVDDGSGSSNAVNEIISLTDLSWLFKNMQVGTELLEYVIGIVNDIYNIINRSGVQMLIFLAGLQSISPAIYESCSIDGATGWETFWKITFPMISPMILVNAIYTVIDAFTSSDNRIMKYIEGMYTNISEGGREIATAMSWIYFIIVIGIVLVVTGIMSAYIFYQRRD
jgi:ABC-type sugar transport system permease subunit